MLLLFSKHCKSHLIHVYPQTYWAIPIRAASVTKPHVTMCAIKEITPLKSERAPYLSLVDGGFEDFFWIHMTELEFHRRKEFHLLRDIQEHHLIGNSS